MMIQMAILTTPYHGSQTQYLRLIDTLSIIFTIAILAFFVTVGKSLGFLQLSDLLSLSLSACSNRSIPLPFIIEKSKL